MRIEVVDNPKVYEARFVDDDDGSVLRITGERRIDLEHAPRVTLTIVDTLNHEASFVLGIDDARRLIAELEAVQHLITRL
jgi:hypothetical protein